MTKIQYFIQFEDVAKEPSLFRPLVESLPVDREFVSEQ